MSHFEAAGCGCRAALRDGFLIAGAEASYAPDLALEPKHVAVRLRFDLEAQTAAGSVTTTIACNRPGARSLRLDAIALDDVAVVDPEGLQWRYDGRAVHLTWDEPFRAGEERSVEVRYSVHRPITGLTFSKPDGAYPDRPFFAGTDHETERARYWLPCVDYPTVRTTFDFFLTAARDLTIVANGTLEGETDHGDGTKTAHWNLDHPCPSYLCCLAIGRFSRHDDESVDGRPIAYLGTGNWSAEDLERSFSRTPAMMRWLEGRVGNPFPFKKYYQLAVPAIGGAMENISLVTWDDRCVLDEALSGEIGHLIDSVNVHEMAHSYFGDTVVCRHFEHSWLKESWATYIESVWREETKGTDEFHYNLHVDANDYTGEADRRYVRPIVTRTYNSSWDLFDHHLYPGGAWRLHMLRHLVGDDAFWAATKDYVATYAGGGLVETDDFRRKVEQHSGLNLNRFFDQWIYGRGYPKLKATFKHDAEKGEATLVVEQTQVDEKREIGLFDLPLEVGYEDEGGWHAATLALEKERHVLVLPVQGKPLQLRFDPHVKALFSLDCNPGDDMAKRTLTEGGDVRGRIRAAAELIKTGTRRNLQAVGAAMAAEPFWGVRAAVARLLGKSNATEAIAPLAAMLGAEADPRAKRFVAMACGKMRDPRLRDALHVFLEQDQPPLARSYALGALGAQRDERDLELLERESKGESIHGHVAAGALRGLGSLGSKAALEMLGRHAAYGSVAEPARAAAAEALGRCARRLDRESRRVAGEQLVDLTRDQDWRVRRAAGSALAGLGGDQAIPALEAMKQSFSEQDGPRVERMIARLRKGPAGEEVTKLREQVDKLEERHRKLDERVQDLEARDSS